MKIIFIIYSLFLFILFAFFYMWSKKCNSKVNYIKIFGGYFIGFLIIFFFMTYTSQFVCNKNECYIKQYNIYGIPLDKKTINISDIDHFYCNSDYSFWGGSYHKNRYYIYSVDKKRNDKQFFTNYIVGESLANKYVAIMNYNLYNLEKYNVNIKFPK